MAQYKEYQILKVWKETHETLKAIADFYTEQQKEEFGSKAKKSTIVEVIDELAKAKLHELVSESKQ